MIDEPRDDLAEQSVLGAMLLAGHTATDVADIVRAEDFHAPIHETLCRVIFDLDGRGEPVDFVTVQAALPRGTALPTGAAYLHDLMAACPAPAAAVHYAKRVARAASLRRLIRAGMSTAQLGYGAGDDTDIDTLIAAAQAALEAVTSTTSSDGPVRVGDVLDDYLTALDDATGEVPGIDWHCRDLRTVLRPLRKGELAIVAAWSGVGKSICLWNFCAHAAINQKQRVLIHALEMSTTEMMDRLISAEARVPLANITGRRLRGEDWDRITAARARIEAAPLWIDDSEQVSVSTLRASTRRHRPDVLCVDQIPIMIPADPRVPKEQQMAAIAYGLKRLAKAEDVAVIAAHQLNRGPASRADKTPTLNDLRDSAAIGHAADKVLLLHDPTLDERESDRSGEMDYLVVKQRSGPKGCVTLCGQPHYARHVDMAA